MNRRGFLTCAGGVLALATAPAIIRAESLMPFKPTASLIAPGSAAWLDCVREWRQFDALRGTFISRWDVVGTAAGHLTQIHVAMESGNGGVAYISRLDAPVVSGWQFTPGQSLEEMRAVAVEALRRHANDAGLSVVKGVLRLADGSECRFLA